MDSYAMVKEVERTLFWGKHALEVRKPVSLWKINGSKPLNAYYGSSQIHGPTAEQVQIPAGTTLHTRHGNLYLDPNCKTQLLWSNPDDKGPFEKSYGPGPCFGLAQRIVAGEFDLMNEVEESAAKLLDALFEKQCKSYVSGPGSGRHEVSAGELEEIASDVDHGQDFEYWLEDGEVRFMWLGGVYELCPSDLAKFRHLLAAKNVKWVPSTGEMEGDIVNGERVPAGTKYSFPDNRADAAQSRNPDDDGPRGSFAGGFGT